jgi:hypothetical protein
MTTETTVLPPGVSIDDISPRLAYEAHRGISFVPEQRSETTRQNYVDVLASDYAELSKLATTDEKRAVLAEEWARYVQGYRNAFRAYLAARSRIVSTMIAGPANFPVRQMEKRNDTAHRRLTEMLERRTKALASIRRKLTPELQPVRSSDPNAVETLTAKVEAAKACQEAMKAANKAIRAAVKSSDRDGTVVYKKGTRETLEGELRSIGFSDRMIAEVLKPDYMGRVGFASYSLSNNNAEIKRLEDRIASLSAMRERETTEVEHDGVTVVENVEAARIQLVFPGKPDEATRSLLKSCGFRWAPSEGAWQRHLNENGRYAVKQVLARLKQVEAVA